MLSKSQAIYDELVATRRDVHMHPELGFAEHRTAELVADRLRSLGLRVEADIGVTGVLGQLGDDGPVVALRADAAIMVCSSRRATRPTIEPDLSGGNFVARRLLPGGPR